MEVLCINDIGRDEAGLQRSCVDVKSCKGFTALYLAASDGVDGVQLTTVLNPFPLHSRNAGATLPKEGNLLQVVEGS